LESLLAKRELYVMEDQLEKDQAKLTEMKETEEVALREDLYNIEDTLWKEYTREELRSTISELKECLADLEKIEQLKKEVERCNVDKEKHNAYKEELAQHTIKLEEKQRLVDKLTAQQELYSCPKCMSKLRLLNEELLLAEDVSGQQLEADLDSIKSEIQSLKYNISKLQSIIPAEEDKMKRKTDADTEIANILLVYEEIPNIDKIREDLEYLHEYQASQVEIEKKKKELELSIQNEKFSSSYQTFKRGIDKLERKIEKLREKLHEKSGDDNEILNEEELRQLIIEQKQMRDKIMELEDRKKKMEQERDRCKRILDKEKKKHIDKYGDIHNEDELARKLQEEEKNIEYQKRKGANHERNLKQIEEWERYQENMEKYQTWVDKVDELDKKEKKARNEYAAATELKNKILESESIAMLNIIDSINTHARVYLDCFFTENPISVNLQTFKQTKKSTKPNINISIEYKGMEADLNMLSGGELSRVILSYTLALAEMFNTPLLLLDECTSSLDQDLTGTVFDAIRENFNGKMTLIIAHQVVSGTFDKVLQLGRTE
jgi:DNA repair exonuclease SbcCD ATPase subunit